MQSSLRTKLILSVGIIIFVVLGTSTFIHIQQLRRDYLEAIEWRSEALAHGMLDNVPFIKTRSPSANLQEALEPLSPLCNLLYQANKEKNVAHVAVINIDGMIVAHNKIDFWKTPVESPVLLKHLQSHTLTTVLDGTTYHTLVPIFGVLEVYLGAIDIGVPKDVVNEKVQQLLLDSLGVFGVFLIVTFIAISALMSLLVAKPIEKLMSVMKEVESGNFDIKARITTNDEFGKLAGAFNRMGYRLRESFQKREQLLGELREKQEALQTLNQELEQRVERRTAELTRQKYILDTFMANVPDSIYFKDLECRFTKINNALAGMLGLDNPAEAIEKTDFDFFPEEQARVKYEQEQEIIRTGTPILTLEEPNTSESWSLTTKMPLRDEHGAIIGTFGISRDITKLKQAEEALKYAKNKAEEANRAKSEFLANMSHELRTPLNVILGLAQIMARDSHIPDEERENLELMRQSGEHLLTLINSILDMSKIEAGHIGLNERNIDLFRLLDELHEMFLLKANQKSISLVFEYGDQIPQYIRTDDIKLRQVLMNLLNNAVKFTEEGEVMLKILDLGFEILDLKEEGQSKICNLKFQIQDTGPGIAPDEIGMLFEPFGQTETGRQIQGGTGLGLTISRKFVQLMGGELTVHSEVGVGTTFVFTTPVKIMTAADVSSSPPNRRVIALEPGQPRYRMLVVDDKPDNRCLLTKLLLPLGFDVCEAANGQEALDFWKEFEPHLIWMDMRMPVMDGYEATKQIREFERKQVTGHRSQVTGRPLSPLTPHHIPIIALTASSFEEDRTMIFSTGCDDYICKPFQEADIFAIMQKYLGIRYVYEEHAGQKGNCEKEQSTLTSAMLSTLPEDLYQGLRQTVEMGDVEVAEHLIAQIRLQDESMAEALANLVKQFRFDLLQEFFIGAGQ